MDFKIRCLKRGNALTSLSLSTRGRARLRSFGVDDLKKRLGVPTDLGLLPSNRIAVAFALARSVHFVISRM